jgi:[ribosomal protein S5]-alanine N-acetyltransferase
VAGVLPITTERLVLRELREDDVAAMHRVYGDPAAMRHVGSERSARTLEQSRASVAHHIEGQRRNGFSLWAVDVRASGRTVGAAGLVHVDGAGPEIELVYQFEQPAWGLGYATEAARACLGAALGPLGLDVVIALAYPENTASIRVMQKCGMTPAGTSDAYGAELVRYEIRASRP